MLTIEIRPKMMTRKEMMDAPKERASEAHDVYYREVAKAAGLRVPESVMRDVRKSTDPHLNDIKLDRWDRLTQGARSALSRALKERGDFYSLAGGTCAFKAAARIQLDAEKE